MKNPANLRELDAVDAILDQWKRERPDLDASPMGPIGRLNRCAALLAPRLNAAFVRFDLSMWEFDVLATLRRSGAPYCLSPTELFSALMVTSGTMTHRLKRLEMRGLVERVANEQDARSLLVQLSSKGMALIDDAVDAHVENERAMLSGLSADTLAALDANLSLLLQSLESQADPQSASWEAD